MTAGVSNLPSPVTLWRQRYSLSQADLARRCELSTPQISKLEAGMYLHLPQVVSVVTSISDDTYQRFKTMKRRTLDVSGVPPLNQFPDVDEWLAWRGAVAWDNFIPNGLGTFAGALCVAMNALQLFENYQTPVLPIAVWNALEQTNGWKPPVPKFRDLEELKHEMIQSQVNAIV